MMEGLGVGVMRFQCLYGSLPAEADTNGGKGRRERRQTCHGRLPIEKKLWRN